MVVDVYMTNRIGDYVVDFMRPNVHMVQGNGSEVYAPIYSPRMYIFCSGADKNIMRKIDVLYAEFLESLKNMDPDDSLTKYLMKSNKKFAKLLGL